MTGFLGKTIAVAVLAAVLTLGSATAAAACTCPWRSDSQCITTGQNGVGSPYWLGHACWSTTNHDWGGADCSGFLVKCWQVPRSSPVGQDYHPYGTYHLFNTSYHWYAISRGSLWKSDAVGYPPPPGASYGHVMMYHYGDPYGYAWVLEATGSRIQKHYRDISSSVWRFRRRHQLTQTYGPG